MNEATPLTSASQTSTFLSCKRQWGFGYLAGIRAPQTPSQVLGDQVDTGQLQPYLQEGRPFDFTMGLGVPAEIATTALEYLPKPKVEGLEVQKHFTMPAMTARRPDGKGALFGYQGYLDLWLPKGGIASGVPDIPIALNGNTPLIIDFKTTSDLKWAKTPAQLKTDPQAMLYATWAMFETGARSVDLQWVYMQTRGARRARRTYLRVFGQDVAEFFPKLDATAVEMFEVRKACGDRQGEEAIPFVLSLPPNPDACSAYGGCPHQHRCNLSPAQYVDSQTAKYGGTKDMPTTAEILAAMKKKKVETIGGGEGGTTPQPAAPAPTTVAINPPETNLAPAPVEAPQPPPAKTEAEVAEAPKGRKPRAAAAPKESVGGTTITVTDIDTLAQLMVEKLVDALAKGLTK